MFMEDHAVRFGKYIIHRFTLKPHSVIFYSIEDLTGL